MSGVKLGKEYCRDINEHTPNATVPDLFKCYKKYAIEHNEEFCDYTYREDDDGLLKCYAKKGIPNNSKYCEIVHLDDIEGLDLCYEEASIQSIRRCDIKHILDM